jgi:fatty-acyl-CoA synthase
MEHAETLTELLETAAARAPGAMALEGGGVTLDYAGFASRVRRVAGGLAAQGIGAGDRVAIWLPNRPDYLVLHFALARLGACAVHLNTRFGRAEVAALLTRTRPVAIATAWGFGAVDFPAMLAGLEAEAVSSLRAVIGLDAAADAASPVAGATLLRFDALLDAPELARDFSSPEAPCLTFTTSGTTSGPKLVLHRQRAIAWHAGDVAARIGTGTPGAALLAVVPFCGTFGLAAAMAAVAGGARIHCLSRFDAAEADAAIRAHRVTHMVGGDDMLLRLAQAAAGRPYAPFAFTGFASFHHAPERLLSACGGLNLALRGVYGSSEAQALFALQDPADPELRHLPGGIPASPLAEVRVAEPGAEEGELAFRGPSLFSEYLGDPAATERARTPDGFFRTGDLGRVQGRAFVFGTRMGDALRLGGFLVNPEEIEAFLASQPGVAAAQVVAAEGRAVAFIVAEPGAAPQEEALIAACQKQLARFKQPARIITLDTFPVTEGPNGIKVQRARLREMAAELS